MLIFFKAMSHAHKLNVTYIEYKKRLCRPVNVKGQGPLFQTEPMYTVSQGWTSVLSGGFRGGRPSLFSTNLTFFNVKLRPKSVILIFL